ncbi:hypothetical protein PHISP_08422, partial [Aspergillus sp. HF37]
GAATPPPTPRSRTRSTCRPLALPAFYAGPIAAAHAPARRDRPPRPGVSRPLYGHRTPTFAFLQALRPPRWGDPVSNRAVVETWWRGKGFTIGGPCASAELGHPFLPDQPTERVLGRSCSGPAAWWYGGPGDGDGVHGVSLRVSRVPRAAPIAPGLHSPR